MRQKRCGRIVVPLGLLLMSSMASLSARAADALQVVYLWEKGSPTLKGAEEKELLSPANPMPNQRINSIRNVHNPSLERV